MNKTMQNKRGFSVGKTFYSKCNSVEKPKNKKHRSFTNIFNNNMNSVQNYININNPYMPFWLTKLILNKNKNNTRQNWYEHFIDRINHRNNLFSKTKNNFHPMKNKTLDFYGKIRKDNLLYDNSKMPKKLKQLPIQNYFQESDSMMNSMNMRQYFLNNKEKMKENYLKFEDDISIGKKQEKQFFQIQKNFSQTRKEIIEEPEYLEEDS